MILVYFLNFVAIISARFCIEKNDEVVCDTLNDLQRIEVSNTKLVLKNNIMNAQLRHLHNSDLIKASNFKIITIDGVLNGIDKGALSAVTNATLIYLRNNEIDNIDAGVFENLNVKTLYLKKNQIKNINKGAFNNLPKVETIDLENNTISIVLTGVFNNLNVRSLGLNENRIFHIENNAFHNMTYLSQLSLGGNKLTLFIPDVLFNYADSIKWLELQNNSLTYLGPETLHGLISLQYFDISGNLLSVIQRGTFDETPNLEMLLLSRNRLVEIDPHSFPTKGLRELFFLNIDHNHLTYLSHDFLAKIEGNKLNEMAVIGNPWQCECLNLIFAWMYNNNVKQNCFTENDYAKGKMPVCVIPDGNSKKCYNTVQISLIETYMDMEVQRKYKIPYCQV